MYPDTVNLPFNGTVIKEDFTPALPGSDDPGGPGYWLIIHGGALVVHVGGSRAVLPEGDLPPEFSAEEVTFLGLWKGKPLRLLRLDRRIPVAHPYSAEPFNAVEDRLDDQLLSLGGLGHQILHWQRQSVCCSRCGAAMTPISGTWGKRCLGCAHEHYPSIHPCIIVLVRRGDSFLLARKPEWAPGRYGLIAGFLDFGESLEECVHREVKEETGIAVTNVRYVGSQCWPFPSQLMAGYIAEYAGGEISIDRHELEDAQWFPLQSLPPALPPRRSIARWIIDTFAQKSV